MNDQLKAKLDDLPKQAGVYFHKNKQGQIIYIGKAANLRNRVRQYFQKSRSRDPKTEALVAEIFDIDWTEVESEVDALFLEAEMVRRYLPRYNILLRDDKSLTYVRIDYDSTHPTVSLTRRPLDDGSKYFGPYYSAISIKRALKYLRRAFPYSTHQTHVPKRVCLQYHLGLCPGLEGGQASLTAYKANLRKLIQYLKGQRVQLSRQIEKDMKTAAARQDYESASTYRNQLLALKSLTNQVIFSDKEFLDISKDQGLSGLADVLGLAHPPRRIEGYDISHMQGTDNVASLVVFVNGLPAKADYRKFKLRLPGNDDFAHMNEALTRRLSPTNVKAWGLPDLFLIDGGKGQLSAAIAARNSHQFAQPMIGLAKREEEIVIHKNGSNVNLNRQSLIKKGAILQESGDFINVLLPKSSHIVKLLQRVRDESHRFAVSYHSVLKTKRQTASLLDDIPLVGPATRKKLLKSFGSVKGLMQASLADIAKVVGAKKAALIDQYLQAYRANNRR